MSEKANRMLTAFGIAALWIMTWSDQYRIAALETRVTALEAAVAAVGSR